MLVCFSYSINKVTFDQTYINLFAKELFSSFNILPNDIYLYSHLTSKLKLFPHQWDIVPLSNIIISYTLFLKNLYTSTHFVQLSHVRHYICDSTMHLLYMAFATN